MGKKIFIGSSTQGLSKAKKVGSLVTRILQEKCLEGSVVVWNDDEFFKLGEYTWESLTRQAHEFSGAIFIYNTDDKVTKEPEDTKELTDDHHDKKTEDTKEFVVTRDNVIAETGLFAGVLGEKAVALCEVPGVHLPTDFGGITHLQYDDSDDSKMKGRLTTWVLGLSEPTHAPNILMKSRRDIHRIFPNDNRLHISDRLYIHIRSIRMMNFASNLVINPEVANPNHLTSGISLANAIQMVMRDSKVNFDLILTEPNSCNLKDVRSKIANSYANKPEGVIFTALEKLYKELNKATLYQQLQSENRFHLYLMKTSMPYAIFNVEFSDEYSSFNHVKIDLYSASISDEDRRRSFVVWKKDDPENYEFFVDNFDSIKINKQLSVPVDKEKLKNWVENWNSRKKG